MIAESFKRIPLASGHAWPEGYLKFTRVGSRSHSLAILEEADLVLCCRKWLKTGRYLLGKWALLAVAGASKIRVPLQIFRVGLLWHTLFALQWVIMQAPKPDPVLNHLVYCAARLPASVVTLFSFEKWCSVPSWKKVVNHGNINMQETLCIARSATKVVQGIMHLM